jgi:N-acetylglucosamine kinase-like BadF-type ATPase
MLPTVQYVMGIDAGGTKTVCLLADEKGSILAEARGPGANLQAAGELGVENVLHQVMEEALTAGDHLPSVIAIGMAGVDRENDLAVVRRIMRRIGFKARTIIVNDALIALLAGAGHEPGIVVLAGTGSIAYGRTLDGRATRAGGWGYVLGDEGSGYWIGRRALRAVVREADGRSPVTALTPRLLRHFGVTRAQGLVEIVYDRNLRPSEIAALAPHVQEAARESDVVAQGILADAADELVAAGASVMRRLDMADASFTFVLGGGIFKAVPWLWAEMPGRLTQLAPKATVVHLTVEPAMGSVRLALDELGGRAVIPTYI